MSAAPAGAATPQLFHTQLNLSFQGIHQCGYTLDSVVQGTLTEEDFVDRAGNVTIQNEAHTVSTLTNEANKKVVHVDNANRDRFNGDLVVHPDGTMTFTDTLTGSPERVYTSHSSVLVKDVGFLSIVDTFDSDENFLSEQVIVHGVHQVSGPDDAYCAAITAAIG